jgi:hypothetical protein
MSQQLKSWAAALGGDVSGRGVRCPGPGHSAIDRSLSVTPSAAAPDGFIVHSFSGDDPIACKDYVRAKLGLPEFKPNGHTKPAKKIYFDYCDETGSVIYQVERTDYYDGGRKKKFLQRRPDGNGGWLWNLDGVHPVPYRLLELLEALAHGRTIVIVEGEAKADLLWSWNIPSTCNSGGAEKWRAEHSAYLSGADTVVLPDNDPAGRAHMDRVAVSLTEAGASVRVLDLPGLGAKGDVVDWAAAGGTRERLDVLIDRDARAWAPSERESVNAESEELPAFAAHPFVWRDPRTIYPRQWLHAGHYIRGFVSATVAPGGLGKSSLQLVEAVGMPAGRDLLRGTPAKTKLNVWYWNLEDPREEIDRRVAAILLHYKIHPDEIKGRLFVNSGRNEPLVIAAAQRGATIVHLQVSKALEAEITRLGIDVLIIDPFVSCHRLLENDNNAIDAVVKTWAGIAENAHCAVELAHHVRKPSNGAQGADFDVHDARGASSLIGGARSVRVLNVMSKDDAEKTGVPEKHRRSYFRCENGKANMRPASDETDWHKFVSVGLGNETVDDPADEVGVVTPWKRPGLFDNMAASDLFKIQKVIAGGSWREDYRSPEWAGIAVTKVLDLDVTNPADRKRITAMLKAWTENKVLKIVEKPDAKRRPKRFLEVGIWAT